MEIKQDFYLNTFIVMVCIRMFYLIGWEPELRFFQIKINNEKMRIIQENKRSYNWESLNSLSNKIKLIQLICSLINKFWLVIKQRNANSQKMLNPQKLNIFLPLGFLKEVRPASLGSKERSKSLDLKHLRVVLGTALLKENFNKLWSSTEICNGFYRT